MTIEVGSELPDSAAFIWEEGPKAVQTNHLFAGKKVVLFAVPGAFTPGCSLAHLPGFVVSADDIKAKGIDTIVCLSVNDPFVMKAWSDAQNAEHIQMLADADANFTKAVDLCLDLAGAGLGLRSQRYAMVVDNGVVSYLGVEPAGEITVSSAEAVLAAL